MRSKFLLMQAGCATDVAANCSGFLTESRAPPRGAAPPGAPDRPHLITQQFRTPRPLIQKPLPLIPRQAPIGLRQLFGSQGARLSGRSRTAPTPGFTFLYCTPQPQISRLLRSKLGEPIPGQPTGGSRLASSSRPPRLSPRKPSLQPSPAPPKPPLRTRTICPILLRASTMRAFPMAPSCMPAGRCASCESRMATSCHRCRKFCLNATAAMCLHRRSTVIRTASVQPLPQQPQRVILRLRCPPQQSECKTTPSQPPRVPNHPQQQTRMPFWPPLPNACANKRPLLAGALDGAGADVGAEEEPQLAPMTFRRLPRSHPPLGVGKPMRLLKLACGAALSPWMRSISKPAAANGSSRCKQPQRASVEPCVLHCAPAYGSQSTQQLPRMPRGVGSFSASLPACSWFRSPGESRIPPAELDRRCELFRAGQWSDLLRQSAAAAGTVPSPPRSDPSDAQRARRAAALVHIGELSAAGHALTAQPLAAGTFDTLAELRDPERRPPVPYAPVPDGVLGHVPAKTCPLPLQDFLRGLRSARRGSAAGPSGTTNEHLRILLDDDEDARLLHGAAVRLANADVPSEVLEGIRVGRLVALQKPNGRVRALVVGDVLRRLVGRVLAQHFAPRLQQACMPHQFGLSTRSGTEAVSRLLRAATEASPRATVLSVDAVGAFDHVSRGAMLTALHARPELQPLLPFARQFYADPCTYTWYDDDGRAHDISQGEGGEQGDPLMPALYALAQHEALCDLHSQLQDGEAVFAFLDDTYVVAAPDRVRTLYDALAAALWDRARIRLHQGKTRIWNAAGGCLDWRFSPLSGLPHPFWRLPRRVSSLGFPGRLSPRSASLLAAGWGGAGRPAY
ncbi:unnamed protein product [Symbiodinium sp. CCMP2592]|nr:unnamed protein product [Symbiodinium sp. CCMP2592]